MRYRMSEGMTNIGTVLKEAMERTPRPKEPEQEPVLWMMPDGKIVNKWGLQFYSNVVGTPLYTTPPQRKPLTHEQRFDLLTKFEPYKNKWGAPAILIDMVEAAHDIKE